MGILKAGLLHGKGEYKVPENCFLILRGISRYIDDQEAITQGRADLAQIIAGGDAEQIVRGNDFLQKIFIEPGLVENG